MYMKYNMKRPLENDPTKLFWYRVSNLKKMCDWTSDIEYKRIWMDKLQELMKIGLVLDKRTLK